MIKKEMFNETLETFELSKVCSIKPDKDSSESKHVTLKIKYDQVTINDLASATLSQGVLVRWQNGQARKRFDSLVDKQIVEVNFKSPGSRNVDPEVEIINKLSSMKSNEEREEYLNNLLNKIK